LAGVQPIASFAAQDARALLGVCFDIDDTITKQGVLEASAYNALFDLARAGLKLIAVTGRPLGFAEVAARMWPVDLAVGENGAGYIARRGHGLHCGYWDEASVRLVQQQKLREIRARVAHEMPHVKVSSDNWARRCDLAFDVGEEERLPRAEIDRLIALLRAEGAHTTVSSVHAHAQLSDHDKALGVARAAHEVLGLSADELRTRFLFVGDSGNDAAAFAWFAHTAGVANVTHFLDRLSVPPRYVAQAERGEGFAEIARTLLQKRRESP
jgi:HAD superfamily hydrolase (TIGR01484 family)